MRKLVLLSLLSAACLCAQETARIKAEFLANFDDAAKKLLSLAEAIPADKYSWRPAAGVRSISEVFVHVAGADFMIPGALGAKMPTDSGLGRDSEKTITDKAKITPLLKRAIDFARQAIDTAMDDPAKATKLFGRESTNSATSLLIITHMHEHLGQAIAYARSNGVTPPWSAGGRE